MIRATCLGHAALLIETENARVLMDPILGAAVSGGGNVIDPPREIRLNALVDLDLVVISHHHSDHFNLADLALIPRAAEHHFVIPDDDGVEATLRRWGARRVTRLLPGQSIEAADLRLTATRSEVPFPEIGILFQQGELRLLNLVDTVFHPHIPELLALCGSGPNVVLAPFQAGGYMSFLPLREEGFPPGLEPAIQAWASEALEELATDLQQLQPKLVVAFADGLAYTDAGINARHFPLPDSAFADRLAASDIRACSARPGLVLQISEGCEPRMEDAPETLVHVAPQRAANRRFDPAVPLSVHPLSWHDLPLGGRDEPRCGNWLTIVRERMEVSLARLREQPKAETIRQVLSSWHLELLAPETRAVIFCDWPENGTPSVHCTDSPPPERSYGIVCHGADLARVALRDLHLEVITLGGLFRYRSPEEDGELERLRGRALRPLDWLFDS
ncbi:MAG TPA: MBL fold metallo-hydrolase [Chthoniobacteraceae bacterium]|jgi:hypothetical protein